MSRAGAQIPMKMCIATIVCVFCLDFPKFVPLRRNLSGPLSLAPLCGHTAGTQHKCKRAVGTLRAHCGQTAGTLRAHSKHTAGGHTSDTCGPPLAQTWPQTNTGDYRGTIAAPSRDYRETGLLLPGCCCKGCCCYQVAAAAGLLLMLLLLPTPLLICY